jgi:polar amino acid transport system substrate-binding protein
MRLWSPVVWWILSFSVAASECPAQLRLAYNTTWLPYVEVTDEQVSGSDIELIRQAVTQVGSELKLQYVPEKRAIRMLQQGLVDVLFAASYTPQRAEYAWFSAPYRKEHNVVLVRQQILQQHPQLGQREAFLALAARKLVGAYNPAGYYGDEFEQVKQLPEVQRRSLAVYEPVRRLDLVSGDRADYTIVDSEAVHADLAQRSDQNKLLILPFYLNSADIHLMLGKKTIKQTCVIALNQVLTARKKTLPTTGPSVSGSD